MAGPITGGCACGAVRYSAAGPVKFVLRCHCRACQHDSGAGHAVHVAAPLDGFAPTGEPRVYARTSDSGHVVRKAFCPTCGCPLYGLPERAPALVMLMAGGLDDPATLPPAKTFYGACAQPWDHVAAAED